MSFSATEKIILDSLKEIRDDQKEQGRYFEERMNETCNTLTEIKTNYTLHIQKEKEEIEAHQRRIDNKYKKVTMLLGLVSGVSLVVGFSKYFI